MVQSDGSNEGPQGLKSLISYRLARLQAKMNAKATRILKEHGGLSLMQWRVLVILDTFETTTITQIARESKFDKALISRTVQGLVRDKLISSRAEKSDLRQHNLKMTAKGRTAFEKAAPAMRARQAQLRAALSPDEYALFFDTLERLEAVTDATEI